MEPIPNVFWKTAIDFRNFDISGRFSFQNDNNRTIQTFNDGPLSYDDQVTIRVGLGAGNNPSFLGEGVTRNGQTITGGSLGLYLDNKPGGYDGYINPLGGSAMASLNSVIKSASLGDDRAFLRDMLAGDDIMFLSGGFSGVPSADYAFGAKGNDSIYGFGGNDTLFGDGGDDFILGGAGRDQIYGGAQNDLLAGAEGRDRVDGGRGADTIAGNAGADTLIGGRGNDALAGGGPGGGGGRDTFLFRANAGDDRINDWQDGQDRIRIETGVNLTFDIDYSGTDAVVTFTKGAGFLDQSITIEDVANNSLQLSQQGNVFFLT